MNLLLNAIAFSHGVTFPWQGDVVARVFAFLFTCTNLGGLAFVLALVNDLIWHKIYLNAPYLVFLGIVIGMSFSALFLGSNGGWEPIYVTQTTYVYYPSTGETLLRDIIRDAMYFFALISFYRGWRIEKKNVGTTLEGFTLRYLGHFFSISCGLWVIFTMRDLLWGTEIANYLSVIPLIIFPIPPILATIGIFRPRFAFKQFIQKQTNEKGAYPTCQAG